MLQIVDVIFIPRQNRSQKGIWKHARTHKQAYMQAGRQAEKQ